MKTLNKPTKQGLKAEKVFRKAVDKVIEENRRLGLPIAVMRNGKAVLLPVEKAIPETREKPATYGGKKKPRK